MDLSRLTNRAQQALLAARDQAVARNHSGIFPLHLLRALIAQADGVVPPLLQAVKINPPALRAAVESALGSLGQVFGGAEPQMTPDLARILETAEERRAEFKDDYISIEHPARPRCHRRVGARGPGGDPGPSAGHVPGPGGDVQRPRAVRA